MQQKAAAGKRMALAVLIICLPPLPKSVLRGLDMNRGGMVSQILCTNYNTLERGLQLQNWLKLAEQWGLTQVHPQVFLFFQIPWLTSLKTPVSGSLHWWRRKISLEHKLLNRNTRPDQFWQKPNTVEKEAFPCPQSASNPSLYADVVILKKH